MSKNSQASPGKKNFINFDETRGSYNTAERMSFSAIRSKSKNQNINRYVLEPETGNKYRVCDLVSPTVLI